MMATVSDDYFAFELLNRLVDNQLCKKEDVIILFGHWFLIKNGFRCIGLGDSVSLLYMFNYSSNNIYSSNFVNGTSNRNYL